MKNQALFSLKDECKKLKCRLLRFLFGALRVKSSGVTLVCKVSVQVHIYLLSDDIQFEVRLDKAVCTDM